MSYNGRIPVPGCVTSVRKSTRDQRLQVQRKREEQLEKDKKDRERQEEAQRFFAQKWAEEDSRKKRGTALGPSIAKSSREGRDRRLQKAFGAFSRSRSRSSRSSDLEAPRRTLVGDLLGDDERSDRRHREAGEEDGRGRRGKEKVEGGWLSKPREEPIEEVAVRTQMTTNTLAASSVLAPGLASGMSSSLAGQAKAEQNKTKVQGFFGLSDSDEDRDSARSALVAKTKRAAASAQLASMRPELPTAQAPRNSVAAVQMKVAQWKANLKGKAATMPDWLQREVAEVMGASGGRF